MELCPPKHTHGMLSQRPLLEVGGNKMGSEKVNICS